MEFTIIRDYYEHKEYLYPTKKVELKQGLTVLVGCNGIGKSTLLKQIKTQCEKKDIPCYSYNNLTDGGSNARSKAGFYGDFSFLSQALCSSEGENINLNLGNCARQLGAFVRNNSNADKLFILFDAIGSGLSIDNIMETKEYLFKTILEDTKSKGIETYIIVATNEYEMVRGESCLLIPSLKYGRFYTYEEYRKYIIKTRKNKDKRYKQEIFKLK